MKICSGFGIFFLRNSTVPIEVSAEPDCQGFGSAELQKCARPKKELCDQKRKIRFCILFCRKKINDKKN